jgi:hypothetical protein
MGITGNIEWFRTISGDISDFAASLTIIDNQYLCLSGFCMSFNIHIGDTIYNGGLGQDSYIAKFDTSGTIISSLFLDSDYSSVNFAIASNSESVYCFGCYRGNISIKGNLMSTNDNLDIYLIKLIPGLSSVNAINSNIFIGTLIYPNPCHDHIHIVSELKPDRINMYNLNGQKILSTENTNSIDVSNINPGVYLIQIIYGDIHQTEKLIVN